MEENCTRQELIEDLKNEKRNIVISTICTCAGIPYGLDIVYNGRYSYDYLLGISLLGLGAAGMKWLIDSIDQYADSKSELKRLK